MAKNFVPLVGGGVQMPASAEAVAADITRLDNAVSELAEDVGVLENMDAGDIPYDSTETYDDNTVGAGLNDLKSDISNVPILEHELGTSVRSSMLEIGRIDDSGNPASHSERCRTKYYVPVSVGDTIILDCTPSISNSAAVIIHYYNSSKTWQGRTGWIYFRNADTQNVVVSTDNIQTQEGFIKLNFVSNDIASYDSVVKVSHTKQTRPETLALANKTQTDILPVPASALVYGYWYKSGSTFVIKRDLNYLRNETPIHVMGGDEVHFTKRTNVLVDVGFRKITDAESATTFTSYTNMPYKAPSEGYIYVNIKAGTVISDVSPYDNLITIKRNTELGAVEYAGSNILYNGYVDDTGAIGSHSTRLVNWQPIHANKGDIIRVNYMDVMFIPREFNRAKTLLAKSSNYITPYYIGGYYTLCGDYVVQNDDCWVLVTFSPLPDTSPESFLPSDYPNLFSVIHAEKNTDFNTAKDTLLRFPKSPYKGVKLDTTAIASQGITFVNGDLWAAVDSTTDYISVIDPETGTVKSTITHDLGHCNSLDYCPETDALITTQADGSIENPKIIIVPDVSNITDSISLSDCVQITVDSSVIDLCATICFGENGREAWIYTGYGSDTPNDLYKIVLGYSSGEYTGSISSYTKYTGMIRDNIDAYALPTYVRYAQDCCYDGYYYLGFGTAGHNFLVIDIDDVRKTYKVIGNYYHKYYDSSYNEIGVEPEGVAINNGRIYCSSRDNTNHLSFFRSFAL